MRRIAVRWVRIRTSYKLSFIRGRPGISFATHNTKYCHKDWRLKYTYAYLNRGIYALCIMYMYKYMTTDDERDNWISISFIYLNFSTFVYLNIILILFMPSKDARYFILRTHDLVPSRPSTKLHLQVQNFPKVKQRNLNVTYNQKVKSLRF